MILLLTGCTVENMSGFSLEENVEYAINQDITLANVNNRGYKYYLPNNMSILDDQEYNQIIICDDTKIYLFVDVISYYNNVEVDYNTDNDLYKFMVLGNGEKQGYLKIFKYNDEFLVEIVYNYGIIEMLVDENKMEKLIVDSIYMLSSIRYNRTVITKLVGEGVFESKETIYEIFGPAVEKKHTLDYIKGNEGNEDPESIE